MNFAEIIFLPFLATVLILDRLLPSKKARVWMLLIASCFFYGWWKPYLLPLLFVTSLLDFYLGKLVFRTSDPRRRKWIVAFSVIANLGFLGYFKYTNFGITILNQVAAFFGHPEAVLQPFDVVLPVGISFYTFQSMSYTLDIAKGQLQPDPKLSRFLCFVTLFPQLVAGPIVRAADLLPQLADDFRNERQPAYFLIIFGLFKKIILADTLGPLLVDPVFGNPGQYNRLSLWLAAYAYAFQIFCDFSGYSDIAIGCGRLLGFEFPKNFAAPYLSGSISEFWRRWHITLGAWFRDYVYVPLGGNRGSRLRWIGASMAVFLLSGLWHGANFTFLIWGLIHGVTFVCERLLSRVWRPLSFVEHPLIQPALHGLRIFLTFNLVTLAWLFFRSQTTAGALSYLKGMFLHLGSETLAPPFALYALAAAALLHLLIEPRVDQAWRAFVRLPALAQASLAMSVAVLIYGNSDAQIAHRAFIYFQF